jgi:hypothetical protein
MVGIKLGPGKWRNHRLNNNLFTYVLFIVRPVPHLRVPRSYLCIHMILNHSERIRKLGSSRFFLGAFLLHDELLYVLVFSVEK